MSGRLVARGRAAWLHATADGECPAASAEDLATRTARIGAIEQAGGVKFNAVVLNDSDLQETRQAVRRLADRLAGVILRDGFEN